LLSLLDSIANRAEKRVDDQRKKLQAEGKSVPSSIQFWGILSANVATIRSILLLDCDVIYDPEPDDPAHANVVVRDKGPDEILTVTEAILASLDLIPRAKIDAYQALHRT
jgi:hypothetical protein